VEAILLACHERQVAAHLDQLLALREQTATPFDGLRRYSAPMPSFATRSGAKTTAPTWPRYRTEARALPAPDVNSRSPFVTWSPRPPRAERSRPTSVLTSRRPTASTRSPPPARSNQGPPSDDSSPSPSRDSRLH